MTKLKCWKLVERGKYSQVYGKVKKPFDELIIADKGARTSAKQSHKWFVAIRGKGLKDNKNKFQALKFANKYMKNHDKC